MADIWQTIAPYVSNWGNVALISVFSIVSLGIAGLLFWWIYQTRRYNIRAIILSRRIGGDGKLSTIKTFIKSGGFFNRKGIEIFKIKGRKKTWPFNRYDYLYPDNTVYFIEDAFNELKPLRIEVNNDKPHIETLDPEDAAWAFAEYERHEQERKKKGFWEMYGNYIFFGFVLFGVIIVLWLLFNNMQQIVVGLQGVSQSLAEVAKQVSENAQALPSDAPH